MKRIFLLSASLFILLTTVAQNPIPHLEKKGSATQLIVNNQPFLILGGELGNSSASSTEYMNSIWPTLEQMNLNTILAPVYWELFEPTEGQFNYQLIDDLLAASRQRNMHLVLLWFGSWKNSMSCYAPAWVKKDTERFPRARDINNNPVEILSPFAESNRLADQKAFVELMRYLKVTDGEQHTVIMIQVENEIGFLPNARDYHPKATEAYLQPVPRELIRYIRSNRNSLKPEFKKIWEENGSKIGGTWPEVFGDNVWTGELFMAWFYGQYVNKIAEAGKEVYQLPMYVNAALNRPNKLPGEYPSAGPLPHLMDIWKAAAPSINLFVPDIYFPNLKHWLDLYVRNNNPLFIPEHRFDESVGSKAYFVIGNYDAIGFSPFSIESTDDPQNNTLTKAYNILAQLSPIILANQGQGLIKGFLLDKEVQRDTFELGGNTIIAKHDFTLGWNAAASEDVWPTAGGLIISVGKDEYYVAGNGIVLNFPGSNDGKTGVGIQSIEEGSFINGAWVPVRRMNGDQDHQGRHLRIPMNEQGIQHLKLYQYQ